MRRALLIAAAGLLLATACGDDDEESEGTSTTTERQDVTITLLTHDSFVVSDDVLEAFTAETGITVKVIKGGDAGTVVNQAILTADDPQADVLFGIDNTFLSRALDAELFVAYEAAGLDRVPDEFQLDAEHRATPVDFGDVCVNYDREAFEAESLAVPESLDDLTEPEYEDQLVVENPATSSPGLAFLLATVAEYGDDGWEDYWSRLRANGVRVVDDWETAYYGEFSGGTGSEGERPLVVSYASSPPAEVHFAESPIDEPPTGVLEATCFRQVELAGILRGTEHEEAAQRLLDFFLSREFQEDMPLNMFVFPVDPDAALPEVFEKHAIVAEDPYDLPAEHIAANREEWIDTWTDIVQR